MIRKDNFNANIYFFMKECLHCRHSLPCSINNDTILMAHVATTTLNHVDGSASRTIQLNSFLQDKSKT